MLIKHLASWRGVRFSKVISIGNACDLNETDFLEYLTDDPDTKIIAMYIEGIKDGIRFKKVLGKATKVKPVILYKGGVTKGGARATLGHTGSLAGNETTWNSLCRQFGVIQVNSLEELADVLVTLLFFPLPRGRSTVVIGGAGGASVTISDLLEKNGLDVPALPQEIKADIRSFVTVAGNSLRNPIDIGQIILEVDKVVETANIVTRWEGTDFLTTFFHPGAFPPTVIPLFIRMIDGIHRVSTLNSKPVAYIILSSIIPEVAAHAYAYFTRTASLSVPVYYSFEGAARAIDLVLRYNKI
jgi:acyl-CoA synthetase (NDP forming)